MTRHNPDSPLRPCFCELCLLADAPLDVAGRRREAFAVFAGAFWLSFGSMLVGAVITWLVLHA